MNKEMNIYMVLNITSYIN